jgi:hypothetical protein
MRSIPIYAKAITASDAHGLDQAAVIYVGGAGNVAVIPEGTGTAVTFVGLSAGDILPVSVIQVMATNTTATSLVALW